MADLAYRNDNALVQRSGTDWGAIWAGMFTFIAIWSVFGLLGMALFANSANPGAQHPATGMNLALGIWAIVLTIIAMYVAGLETGRLAAVANRHDGLIHGMIMFGLSVAALLLVSVIGGMTLSGGTGVAESARNPYILSAFSGSAWIGFLSLFLGWLAAMGGASTGASSRHVAAPAVSKPSDVAQQIRPAA